MKAISEKTTVNVIDKRASILKRIEQWSNESDHSKNIISKEQFNQRLAEIAAENKKKLNVK